MKEEDPLSNRVTLITGASSGIGAASVRLLAREGTNLALAARRENKLKRLANEVNEAFNIDTLVIPTNVRNEEEVKEMIQVTLDMWGRLDILINNAGLGLGGNVEELTTEQYRVMMETNIDGVFFATREALPHLKDTKGNLIFIGSFAGQYPRSFNPVYAATKWWIRGFAHSVEASSGSEGVGITVINPTEVRTEFGSEEGEPQEEKFEPGEVTEPEEIGEAIVFAAKQKNSTASEIDIYRRDKLAHF